MSHSRSRGGQGPLSRFGTGRDVPDAGTWTQRGAGKKRGHDEGGKNSDDDGHFLSPAQQRQHHVRVQPTLSLVLPQLARLTLRLFLGATVALYVLNQKHLLPKNLASWVSKALFYPSLPLTVASRIGKWTTVIDDTVMMGGAPFGFAGFPERLYEHYGVRAVVNLCHEYRGPVKKYDQLGMRELWLRTVDHCEPSVNDLKKAVSFIEEIEASGEGRVYVHCRAGHGRSAAVVFAWLMRKSPGTEPERLNAWLCTKRNVRKTLWKQRNIKEFRKSLRIRPKEAERGEADEFAEYSSCETEADTDVSLESDDISLDREESYVAEAEQF